MQCPACNYIADPRVNQDHSRCPKCGRFYAQAAQDYGNPEKSSEQTGAMRPASSSPASTQPASHVKKIAADNRGAQPVVVVDVHMSFGSMVWFMVKWAVAAIPALVILIFIAFFLVLFLAGVVGFSR